MHNGNPPEYDVYNELPGFDPKIFTAYQVYDSYYHKRRAVSPFVPSYEIVELTCCIYRELINTRFPELKDRVLISRNGSEILDLLLTPSGYSETLDQVSMSHTEDVEIRNFRSIHGFYLCPNHGEIKINLDDVLRCGYLCPACKKEGVTLGTASPSCSDILKSLTDQQKKRLYKLDKRWSTPVLQDLLQVQCLHPRPGGRLGGSCRRSVRSVRSRGIRSRGHGKGDSHIRSSKSQSNSQSKSQGRGQRKGKGKGVCRKNLKPTSVRQPVNHQLTNPQTLRVAN